MKKKPGGLLGLAEESEDRGSTDRFSDWGDLVDLRALLPQSRVKFRGKVWTVVLMSSGERTITKASQAKRVKSWSHVYATQDGLGAQLFTTCKCESVEVTAVMDLVIGEVAGYVCTACRNRAGAIQLERAAAEWERRGNRKQASTLRARIIHQSKEK